GAEIAGQGDDHAALQRRGEARTERLGSCGVRSGQRGRHVIRDSPSSHNEAVTHVRLARCLNAILSPPSMETASPATRDWSALAANVAQWGRELGFQEIGITNTDLAGDEARLMEW